MKPQDFMKIVRSELVYLGQGLEAGNLLSNDSESSVEGL
jgi:hypothetical protein